MWSQAMAILHASICTYYLRKITSISDWSQQANKFPLLGFNFWLLTFGYKNPTKPLK